MAKFLLFLLTLAIVVAASSNGRAAATATDNYDDDLARRQEYMAEVVRLGARPELAAAADAETTHRLAMFLKREMGPIETIFHAIRRMPEKSADEVRTKEEAFEAAMDLLARHVRLLLPNGCPACAKAGGDAGSFGLSEEMPQENSTAVDTGFAVRMVAPEVRSQEEARAKAKELMNRLLDGGSLNVDDDDM